MSNLSTYMVYRNLVQIEIIEMFPSYARFFAIPKSKQVKIKS